MMELQINLVTSHHLHLQAMRKNVIWTVIIGWLACLTTTAQPLCNILQYDEDDGVPSSHLTQLLQDEQGFMWFATWNGLCRYDGYEFQTFKPKVGDGCHMTTDRIRNINLLPGGLILCQVDTEYYIFDLDNYRFRDLTDQERQHTKEYTWDYRQSRSLLNGKHYTWTDSHQTQWTVQGDGVLTYLHDGKETEYPLPVSFKTLTFVATDNQGNLWAIDYGSIYRFSTRKQPVQRLAIEPRAEVKCLFADSKGHFFITTKDDKVVRVYSSMDHHLLGYLGPDGRVHQSYTPFGAAVYCMYEDKDSTLWLGTKPDGLFRLQPIGAEAYQIAHFTDLPNTDIYHIQEDRWGRLWVASLGGGIFYTSQQKTEKPLFLIPRHYPKDSNARCRYLFFTKNDIMMVATGNGLVVTKMERDADKMHFQCHQREPARKNSLSCSAVMDVTEDRQERYFVGTESGGVNLIEGADLLAQKLSFRPLSSHLFPLTSDVVQSLATIKEGGLIAVGSHHVTLLDSTLQGRVLDAHFFNSDYRFSEAHPLALGNSHWLFGLTDGAFITTLQQMTVHTMKPRVVLTQIEVRGKKSEVRSTWGAEALDTLILQPQERNLTVRFAALDYSASERINYAFRLSTDDQWNYIGHDRTATLLDMEPGTYLLEIRSTNADGEWQDNIRSITVIVLPTFWEAWYGQLLILILLIGILAAITYTILYIRRIRCQHRETLEKYLALIEGRGEMSDVRRKKEEGKSEEEEVRLDPMLERVMTFIEENISNGDIGVGDMASAAATSRSGLQRKLKQTMGITPQDLLREARIKRACQLLRNSNKTVAEVAYACGFTDPKYFSRCFKQSTGQSPTEWKNASE